MISMAVAEHGRVESSSAGQNLEDRGLRDVTKTPTVAIVDPVM
jgi:hypothetical protein